MEVKINDHTKTITIIKGGNIRDVIKFMQVFEKVYGSDYTVEIENLKIEYVYVQNPTINEPVIYPQINPDITPKQPFWKDNEIICETKGITPNGEFIYSINMTAK